MGVCYIVVGRYLLGHRGGCMRNNGAVSAGEGPKQGSSARKHYASRFSGSVLITTGLLGYLRETAICCHEADEDREVGRGPQEGETRRGRKMCGRWRGGEENRERRDRERGGVDNEPRTAK